jgi:hypothetical protein
MLVQLNRAAGEAVSSLAAAGPARRVFAGVDWAQDNHVACLVDADGQVIDRITIGHDRAGIARLITVLSGAEVAGVGIERGDGPLVVAYSRRNCRCS